MTLVAVDSLEISFHPVQHCYNFTPSFYSCCMWILLYALLTLVLTYIWNCMLTITKEVEHVNAFVITKLRLVWISELYSNLIGIHLYVYVLRMYVCGCVPNLIVFKIWSKFKLKWSNVVNYSNRKHIQYILTHTHTRAHKHTIGTVKRQK